MPTPQNHHRLAHMAEYPWDDGGPHFSFAWAGDVDVPARRVYSFVFLTDGQMVLVGDGVDDHLWLPGGGVEAGESAEVGLRRELVEEAAADVVAMRRLGMLRVTHADGRTEHHAFYWVKAELRDNWEPEHEISRMKIVEQENFLDTLFWGRSDPRASTLMESALACEREYLAG